MALLVLYGLHTHEHNLLYGLLLGFYEDDAFYCFYDFLIYCV